MKVDVQLCFGEGTKSDYIDGFINQFFVAFVSACEFKGVREHSFAFFHAGDDIRAAEPVGFIEVGLRPLRWVVRMGVIKADDVFFSLAAFALNAHEFLGVDVVAVLRRIRAGIAGAGNRGYNARAVVVKVPEQHAATLVRVRLLAVRADGIVVGLAKSEQENLVIG